MKKSAFFVFLLVLTLGVTSAFALTDDEYRILISTSQAFKEADKELGRVWKEVYEGLSEKDKKYHMDGQQKWIRKWRDDYVQNVMKLGMSKAEAYTEATLKRINLLRILQHNSKLSEADNAAGRAWPDYYFEEWHQEQLRQFKAIFDSSVFFDMEALMRTAGIENKNGKKQNVDENDHNIPHYANAKVSYDEEFTFYLIDEHPFYVTVDKKGYNAAGMQVGDDIDRDSLIKFNWGMTFMGWDDMYEDESKHMYNWILQREVDEVKRPVQRFSITSENGTIKSIEWGSIVID